MAISFIGSNTQDSGGALSLTFTIPGAAQADDFMVAFVKQSENTGGQIWDDDGGGGNGWIRLAYNRTTSGRDQETAIYYKIHSGSESNPTFTWNTGGTAEPMSGSLLVYRGVDVNTPIQDWAFLQAQNDANPPNPGVNLAATPSQVLCFHAATHDDISAVAAPTGFTLRTQVWSGTANDHRNHFTADLSVATSGSYTPPDWQHSVLNTTPEYHTYTLALQETQPIGVTSYDNTSNYGDTEILAGFGFEATQGTGKVELWSDVTGTTKVLQTVNTWSDTSLNVTYVQGALSDNTTVYLVVTNDTGDETPPLALLVGLPPYDVIISNQAPDHWWTLNNDAYADSGDFSNIPLTNAVIGGGGSFVTTPISEDTTHSWEATLGVRREPSNSNAMNGTTTTNRLMGGWIQIPSIYQTLSCLYEEGGGVNNLAFFLGLGNVLIAQLADTGDDNVQAFSDFALEPNRAYHILFRFSYTDVTKEFRLYIDGQLQAVTSGNPLTATDLDGHSGDISFGGPGGNLEVAGTDVLFGTQDGTLYSNWVTWSESKSEADILELFRRGARPDLTISADTSANMQIALDAIADTVRGNAPLCIRVEKPTDGNSLSLDADNITFNPSATIQVEWRGSGTLTWTNLNGSNFVSEKGYASNGGTITIVNPATLTLTGLQNPTEVRVYDAGTTTEVAGQESVTSGTFSATIQIPSVDIQVIALSYENLRLEGIDTSVDASLPIQQRFDRNYSNP